MLVMEGPIVVLFLYSLPIVQCGKLEQNVFLDNSRILVIHIGIGIL